MKQITEPSPLKFWMAWMTPSILLMLSVVYIITAYRTRSVQPVKVTQASMWAQAPEDRPVGVISHNGDIWIVYESRTAVRVNNYQK